MRQALLSGLQSRGRLSSSAAQFSELGFCRLAPSGITEVPPLVIQLKTWQFGKLFGKQSNWPKIFSVGTKTGMSLPIFRGIENLQNTPLRSHSALAGDF